MLVIARPKFRLEEAWDDSGDVDIYFDEPTSDDLRERVGNELRYFVPQLKTEERSIYHLEKIVGGIFDKMSKSGNLMVRNKRWVWAEEV
ncbi:hypothetical protein LCGC14_1868970 [marine sediment metagenome]|uniref:Uncharacterized protein n=1 Tax=marine sediment metagenome TaxID=412755 RepID=A0A0F9GTN7_9ZZZZ